MEVLSIYILENSLLLNAESSIFSEYPLYRRNKFTKRQGLKKYVTIWIEVYSEELNVKIQKKK